MNKTVQEIIKHIRVHVHIHMCAHAHMHKKKIHTGIFQEKLGFSIENYQLLALCS